MLWLITATNPDRSHRQWAQMIDADAAHTARAIVIAARTDPFCKRNTEYEAKPL